MVTSKLIRRAALCYCALPALLFLMLWLRPLLGILLAALLAASLLFKAQPFVYELSPFERLVNGMHRWSSRQDNAALPLSVVGLAALVAVVWCVLGGQGGIWFQNGDWDGRNAIFRDLITHAWPVVYQHDGAALCYYVAHWLPSALVGKLLYLAFGAELGWTLSNLVLLLWTAAGVLLVFLLAIDLLGVRTRSMALAVALLLMLFSTPDALGMVLAGTTSRMHSQIEWWAMNAQFSSISTCLFYVFNQAVIPWICTLLFLREKSPSRYIALWVPCLLAGPFPAVGLAALMLVEGVSQLIGSKSRAELVKKVFSVQNLLALLPALAVGLFYLSTTAYEPGEEWAQHNLLPFPLYVPSLANEQWAFVLFVLLEGLLIPFLLWRNGASRSQTACLAVLLCACPFVRTSGTADFCMRVSLPLLFVLALASVDCLMSRLFVDRKRSPWAIALAAVLCIGMVTPAWDIAFGTGRVLEKGLGGATRDAYVSFEQHLDWPRSHFVVAPNKQTGLYYRYLAKGPLGSEFIGPYGSQ